MESSNMDTKAYHKKIWRDAISKARKKYDIRADFMKTVFGILLVLLIIIILVGLGMWNKNEYIPAFMWGLFGADILGIVATSIAVPIVAYLDRWNVAAERDQKQENDKKELQKVVETKQEQIDELENWKNNFEQLANAEKITLQKIDMGSAIGIEIHNGETRHSFEGTLWISSVANTRRFGPVKAKVEHTSETLFHIPPGERVAVRLIDINYPDANPIYHYEASINIDGMNYINLYAPGEYIITTRVAGNFLDPKVSVSFQKKWKFIAAMETSTSDLVPIEERVDEAEENQDRNIK